MESFVCLAMSRLVAGPVLLALWRLPPSPLTAAYLDHCQVDAANAAGKPGAELTEPCRLKLLRSSRSRCAPNMGRSDDPFSVLETAASSWLRSQPSHGKCHYPLSRYQGLGSRDAKSAALANVGSSHIERLKLFADFAASLKGRTSRMILPVARKIYAERCPLVFPLAREIQATELQERDRVCKMFQIAEFNRRRTGFRIWHIAASLVDQDIQLCAVDGARSLLGAVLRAGLPFI